MQCHNDEQRQICPEVILCISLLAKPFPASVSHTTSCRQTEVCTPSCGAVLCFGECGWPAPMGAVIRRTSCVMHHGGSGCCLPWFAVLLSPFCFVGLQENHEQHCCPHDLAVDKYKEFLCYQLFPCLIRFISILCSNNIICPVEV